MTARRAQALRHGAGAALWQRALGDLAPAADGAGARDSLVCAVAMALGDLPVRRGDDAVAAAALLVALDPRWGRGGYLGRRTRRGPCAWWRRRGTSFLA